MTQTSSEMTVATAATIRFAIASDAAALANLRYAFRASTGTATEPKPDFLSRCITWMETHLADNGSWRCWVAEESEALMAAVWLQLIEKIPNPTGERERHGYITNFYVTESARGRGLGSSLLSEVIRWCEAHNVHSIILWPTERSRTLYERHGFAVHEDILELIVNAPPR